VKKIFLYVIFILHVGISYANDIAENLDEQEDTRSDKRTIEELENGRKVFWVGEEISIPISTLCINCFINTPFTLKDGNGNVLMNFYFKRKEPLTDDEIELYYPAGANNGDPKDHWRNNQKFWNELTGVATQPGVYNGTIQIQGEEGYYFYGEASLSISFEVKPLDSANGMALPPNSKGTVISSDAAASYDRQAEIYSQIKNNTNSRQSLDNPYFDYYMTLPHDTITGVFSIWAIPQDACIEILDCGNRNYVFRHRYNGIRNLEAGDTLGLIQLALYDAGPIRKFTPLDRFLPMNEKKEEAGLNNDYSYLYPLASYQSSAARNPHYNYKMASFEGNGRLLYGSYPEWLNSSCHIITPGNRDLRPSDKIQYWATPKEKLGLCTDHNLPNSGDGDVGHSTGNNLTVRFQDGFQDNPMQGEFKFSIANTRTSDIPIDGYELRFYYGGSQNADASSIKFTHNFNDEFLVSNEKCAENQYVLKIKMPNGAVAKANKSYPEYTEMRVYAQNEPWGKFTKADMYSWIGATEMTDNPKIALFNAEGDLVYGVPHFDCSQATSAEHDDHIVLSVYENESLVDDIIYDERGVLTRIEKGKAQIRLDVKNNGKVDVDGPLYVKYYITHPVGQIPLLSAYGKEMTSANMETVLNSDLSVIRHSAGNKHIFTFTLRDGLKSGAQISIPFDLKDNCIYCINSNEANKYFAWNAEDDWSVAPNWNELNKNGEGETDKVVVISKDNVKLYGLSDPYAPSYKIKTETGDNPIVEIPEIVVQKQFPNRTDVTEYSEGQLLSNGGFEEQSLNGWTLESGQATSVRGETIQGSRFLRLKGSISYTLPSESSILLADSGAVLSFWYRNDKCEEMQPTCRFSAIVTSYLLGDETRLLESFTFESSKKWKYITIPLDKERFKNGERVYSDDFVIKFTVPFGEVDLDDVILSPGSTVKPSTYAVRLTTTQHEELETRAFDNERDSVVVTSSKRDSMGRPQYKYLPFKLKCSNEVTCNTDERTLENPSMAKDYYTEKNSEYPDAKGFPFVETRWKPDPAATKDVEGSPGKAFSLSGNHVVRAYSSGVNLTNINLMDSASLASAVNAVRNIRVYDNGVENFHAVKDENPTHVWELNIDQNDKAAFTVKDGNGNVIVSGALQKTSSTDAGAVAYKLATRSVMEYDARGNVIKSHPPISCEYTNASTNCVNPSTFEYDSQSRVIKSWEPDAGTTITYYDIAGRIRASQTQRQIDSNVFSVVGYDYLDRTIYSGEWKTSRDSGAVRAYFNNISNFANPPVDSLTPGSVTRTFYDEVPPQETLGVKLYPDGVRLAYTQGRVAAVISDVQVITGDSVIRISTANSYDKYGRVLETYSFDPTMPESADSLRQLAIKSKYDIGGKLLSTTKYPYGLSDAGKARGITEYYTYDRLGRISRINTKTGNANLSELARYEYYPTGSVKTVILGNSLRLNYTYHISGAIKTAVVKSAENREIYADTLFYEDCGNESCTPQYNGNISRMAHHLAHGNDNYSEFRDVQYTYDELNRLTKVKDAKLPMFDEMFEYDAQGRITAQHRAKLLNGEFRLGANPGGGEYVYNTGSNKLLSVTDGIGGSADKRKMSSPNNFVYDSEGNLTEDKSKGLKILYDWRGMPIEFTQYTQPTGSSGDTLFKLLMKYDGAGRRISKTSMRKSVNSDVWDTAQVTHYTGIGTEVRENYAGSTKDTKVVVNMPQGLGRYGIEDAESPNYDGVTGDSLAGYIPNAKFEWYLKNHIGSTMLVYGTQSDANPQHVFVGTPLAAYDYRAFGEMVEMLPPAQKVTENFTGKEHDDEIALDYFGARYLDPMLGMWISVDPKRQFASPYLYAGNEMNPINGLDSDGNVFAENEHGINVGQAIYDNLAKENFFGSDILKNDWDEMKNSDRMITFNYSSMEEGGHSWKSQDAIDINLNYKNNLVMSAIIGRHEWDHLKGVKKASWHENPKKDFIKDVPYVDLLGVNNAIREGTLPKDHEAYGKEYDPIYGRDYDAFMQLELK